MGMLSSSSSSWTTWFSPILLAMRTSDSSQAEITMAAPQRPGKSGLRGIQTSNQTPLEFSPSPIIYELYALEQLTSPGLPPFLPGKNGATVISYEDTR